ncbi:MAG: hypothetical protein ABF665_08005 [Gluconacetobacter sp.]
MANAITEWFKNGAFDPVNIYLEHPSQFQRLVHEVFPILRERGAIRSDYAATTLRGNLGL